MTMHRLLLFLFLVLVSFSNYCYSDDSEVIINMHDLGHHGTHFDLPIPADMPDVYYNSSAQQIIIDGTGCVSYYDVEITSQSTWDVVVSTSVNGSYDTIDISSLPDDDYIITIDSPLGNTYEGYFLTY